MKFLAAALIFPAVVWSAPCGESRFGACTADAVQKTEIMDAIQAGFAAEKKMLEASGRREMAKAKFQKEETLAETEEVLKREREMRDQFSLAIELTEKYYRLNPGKPMNPTIRPKDPKGLGEWAGGLTVRWKPEFQYGTEDYREIQGSDGLTHYLGGKWDLQETASGTYPDGTVVILRKVFAAAREDRSPGILAASIHHEAQHFEELITRGWDNYEEGELRTYQKSLAAGDVFELSRAQIGKIEEKISKRSGELAAGKRSSLFPSAQGEKENREKFLERKENDREFFERLSRLKQEVAEDHRRRQQDREAQERAEAERAKEETAAIVAFRLLVAEFGFVVYEFGPGWVDLRDTHFPWPNLKFHRFHFKTFGEARAALFLARSCIDRAMAEPDGGALDILGRRSGEEAFRAAIKPNSGELENCFDYLLFYNELLGKAAGFREVLGGHLARERAVKAEIERLERILRVSQERERKERARRPREREDGEGGGRGNLDLSPADRALERARDRIGRGPR